MGEVIVGLLGVAATVIVYFLGVRQGRKQDDARRAHEANMDRERRAHELALEHERRGHELAARVADEYVRMTRGRIDSGIHALASLALDKLGSDTLIRVAVQEMHVRSGADPWGSKGAVVDDIDLVEFFRFARENKIDFFRVGNTVESVADAVRKQGRTRPTA